MTPPGERIPELADELIAHGVRRVHVFAWRDLDDPDAGGSERHADEFMSRWAAAGLDIVHRTSAGAGLASTAERHGYRVIRRGGRMTVFPRTIVSEATGTMGRSDALVEIWNGVPWLGPVWYRGPRVTMFHHVHGPMWDQIFPMPLAAVGRRLEARWAPLLYRRLPTVTPSEATRDELVELGFDPACVTAVPNGVEPFWCPGGARSSHPSVIAVGRLAPVKRFDLAVRAAVEAKRDHPELTFDIVGIGPEDVRLRQLIDAHDAAGWIRLRGRVGRDELRAAYRSAWLVVSGSLAEGWGLSLTEGAACGTPCVATDIRGHRSSVVDGTTGVLAPPDRLGTAISELLADPARLDRLAAAARVRAATLTWEASATHLLRVLRDETLRWAAIRSA